MADYSKVREILERNRYESEILTTLGEIEMPTREYDPSPLVGLVVKGEKGEPVVMIGSLLSKNDYFRQALVDIGSGTSEFSFDSPALLHSQH